ncbi:MAG: hypothetical protein U0175_29195 [Caldilineaceae bacterium]
MLTRTLTITVFVLLILLTSVAPAWAAPGNPPGTTAIGCSWNGAYYPSGTLRASPIIFNGHVLRIDTYQCQNGKWVYRYSSDDHR